jgi:hypothetical protein
MMFVSVHGLSGSAEHSVLHDSGLETGTQHLQRARKPINNLLEAACFEIASSFPSFHTFVCKEASERGGCGGDCMQKEREQSRVHSLPSSGGGRLLIKQVPIVYEM